MEHWCVKATLKTKKEVVFVFSVDNHCLFERQNLSSFCLSKDISRAYIGNALQLLRKCSATAMQCSAIATEMLCNCYGNAPDCSATALKVRLRIPDLSKTENEGRIRIAVPKWSTELSRLSCTEI